MISRIIIFSSILLLFWSCSSNKNVYKESDYKLVKIDSRYDTPNARIFVYKYDTSRKMQINYYFSGVRFAKGFSYKGKIEGPLELYDEHGKLFSRDSLHNGVTYFHKIFKKEN